MIWLRSNCLFGTVILRAGNELCMAARLSGVGEKHGALGAWMLFEHTVSRNAVRENDTEIVSETSKHAPHDKRLPRQMPVTRIIGFCYLDINIIRHRVRDCRLRHRDVRTAFHRESDGRPQEDLVQAIG